MSDYEFVEIIVCSAVFVKKKKLFLNSKKSKRLLCTNVELKFLVVFTALCKIMGSTKFALVVKFIIYFLVNSIFSNA